MYVAGSRCRDPRTSPAIRSRGLGFSGQDRDLDGVRVIAGGSNADPDRQVARIRTAAARMPEPASSPAPISSDVTDATAECQNPAAVGAFGVVHGYGDERVPSG